MSISVDRKRLELYRNFLTIYVNHFCNNGNDTIFVFKIIYFSILLHSTSAYINPKNPCKFNVEEVSLNLELKFILEDAKFRCFNKINVAVVVDSVLLNIRHLFLWGTIFNINKYCEIFFS